MAIIRVLSIIHAFIFTYHLHAQKVSLPQVQSAVENGSINELIYGDLKLDPNYKDRKILRYLLLIDDPKIIASLSEVIFPKIRHLGVKYDIIRAASFFSNVEDRVALISEARSLLNSNYLSELDRFLSKYLNPDPPDKLPKGYYLEREFIGLGKYSFVSLLRRKSDQRLFAWKRKTGVNSKHGDAFRRHFNLFQIWKALGVADGEMIFLSDENKHESILHEFVPGLTLKQKYERSNFFARKESLEFKKLIDLFFILVKNHIIFLDLNSKNIIFNGHKWQVIDSQRPEIFKSSEDTYSRLRKVVTNKWTNSHNRISESDVDYFFDVLKMKIKKELIQNDKGPSKKVLNVANKVLELHNTGNLIAPFSTVECVELLK